MQENYDKSAHDGRCEARHKPGLPDEALNWLAVVLGAAAFSYKLAEVSVFVRWRVGVVPTRREHDSTREGKLFFCDLCCCVIDERNEEHAYFQKL